MSSVRRVLVSVLGVTLIGGALLVYAVLGHHANAPAAYLAAFGFVFSTVLGALTMLAIGLTVQARWFVVLRRPCEGIASMAFLLPLFFLPIACALGAIFPWLGGDESAVTLRRASVLGHAWLSAGPFLIRSALYLLAWVSLTELLRRASDAEDRAQRSWLRARRRSLGALGLPLLGFTGTWATFDWLMSSVPGWNMTSAGLDVLTGGFASALGCLAIAVYFARRRKLLPPQVSAAHSLALGRLLFSAVCLWAYVSVSQLIIVWSANIPRESAFYVARTRGSWSYLAGTLVVGHFIAPFLLLLSRALKQRFGFMAVLGAVIVTMHALDLYWLIAPRANRTPSLLDAAPFLLLGGLSVWLGLARFDPNRAVPLHDPGLARSLGYRSP